MTGTAKTRLRVGDLWTLAATLRKRLRWPEHLAIALGLAAACLAGAIVGGLVQAGHLPEVLRHRDANWWVALGAIGQCVAAVFVVIGILYGRLQLKILVDSSKLSFLDKSYELVDEREQVDARRFIRERGNLQVYLSLKTHHRDFRQHLTSLQYANAKLVADRLDIVAARLESSGIEKRIFLNVYSTKIGDMWYILQDFVRSLRLERKQRDAVTRPYCDSFENLAHYSFKHYEDIDSIRRRIG